MDCLCLDLVRSGRTKKKRNRKREWTPEELEWRVWLPKAILKQTERKQAHKEVTVSLLPFDQPPPPYSVQDLVTTSCSRSNQNASLEEIDDILSTFKDEGLFVFVDFLQMGEVIGKGHFGRVFKANLNLPLPTEVAVKTIGKGTDFRVMKNSTRLFLEEAITMKEFHHDNILDLIGVSQKRNGLPMIITLYMKHGDLLSYIRNELNSPTVKNLIEFGVQIAEGMRYLASIRFVHRDLAARNCLLEEGMTVKISDFGLTRSMYEKAYYNSKNRTALPIRWMAIESIVNYKFTLKSDVWSFGIVLWELITRGMFPYPDVESWNLRTFLQAGHRMARSEYCPSGLYDIMQQCWRENPNDRPSFERILEDVRSLLDHLEQRFSCQQVEVVSDSNLSEAASCDGYDPDVSETYG